VVLEAVAVALEGEDLGAVDELSDSDQAKRRRVDHDGFAQRTVLSINSDIQLGKPR
jgi:hypothetical protein